MSKNRPKPLDIVAANLVDRLWDESDPVCDAKARVIVRSVLGQVAADAAREAIRKDRLASSRLTTAEVEVLRGLVAAELEDDEIIAIRARNAVGVIAKIVGEGT